MGKVERFEDLKVWQSAIKIAVSVFQTCDGGKLKTDFGTKDQLQRAAMSISNNIAEGFEYDSPPNFIRFLKYAKGSAGELRSQLYVLKEIGYIDAGYYQLKQEELLVLSRQLAAFINYLKDYQIEK